MFNEEERPHKAHVTWTPHQLIPEFLVGPNSSADLIFLLNGPQSTANGRSALALGDSEVKDLQFLQGDPRTLSSSVCGYAECQHPGAKCVLTYSL